MFAHHPRHGAARRSIRHRTRRALAALSSLALVIGLAAVGGLGTAPAAAAEEDGIYNVAVNTASEYDGLPVVSGSGNGLFFEYNTSAAGKTFSFDFPGDVGEFSFPLTNAVNNEISEDCVADNVPSGLNAISCMGYKDGSLTVTFKANISSGGYYVLDFDVDTVSGNHDEKVSWSLDSEELGSVRIIVSDGSTDFPPLQDGYAKTVSPTSVDLNEYYEYDGTDVTAVAGMNLADVVFSYTVTALVPEGESVATIADTVEAPLVFDTDYELTVTEWSGLTPSTVTTPGSLSLGPDDRSFSLGVTPTGPAEITLTYTAHVDTSTIASTLETFADDAGHESASTTISASNEVTFDGDNSRTATVDMTWNKPGVTLASNSKTLTDDTLGGCLEVTETGVDASDCVGQTLSYTLTYSSNRDTAGTVTITDALPDGLEYATPVTATISTWNNAGTKVTEDVDLASSITTTTSGSATATSGQSFEADITGVPAGPATITLTYDAKIAVISTALQDALDSSFAALGPDSGTVSATLVNNVTFDPDGVGPDNGSATKTVTATKDGITPGSDFDKTASWSQQSVTGANDEANALTEPIAIDYTLHANLSGLAAGADNVIVEDSAPEGMTWTGDVAIASGAIVGVSGLQDNTTVSCELAAFTTGSQPGDYCISGDDTLLLVNIGGSSGTNVQISATAQVSSDLSGLTGTDISNDSYPSGTQRFDFQNTATFRYGPGKTSAPSVDAALYVRPTTTNPDGYNAPDVFKKAAAGGEVTVERGESVDIDYTFSVGANQGIDLTKSTIIDYIDTSVFELPTDLTSIITAASYDGTPWSPDPGQYFSVSQNGDGDLEIELNDDGEAKISDPDRAFTLTITLTTIEFDANSDETLTIYNKAVLSGEDEQPTYWSQVTAQATSYGDEYEYQKFVYDRHATKTAPWVREVNSLVDDQGTLFDNPFIYRISFVTHGAYGSIPVEPAVLADTLPDGAEVLGFVQPDGDGVFDFDGLNPVTTDQDLGDNVYASVTQNPSGPDLIEIGRLEGGKYQQGAGPQTYSVYVAVSIETDGDNPIVNSIEPYGSATINPASAGITWQKTDSAASGELLGGSTWTISGTDIEGDAVSVDVIDNGDRDTDTTPGVITVRGLNYGTYTLTETGAPDGYLLGTDSYDFTIDADNLFIDLDAVTNVAKTYAVGDYVWIDTNRDGVQDANEQPLSGVTVTLYDGDGNMLRHTQTDANGYYVFDNLRAGDYQVRFQLTAQQAKKYSFTSYLSGSDTAADSNAGTGGYSTVFTLGPESPLLTASDYLELTDGEGHSVEASEGIDPTWDAGVVLKKVSVGDYVWFDANRDGLQGDDEAGIGGVTLCLVGPDGAPVTDVYGNPVGPVVTDDNGYYVFENLPVLDGDQVYTVCIDREASTEALKEYAPTTPNAGTDRAVDSDTWTASTIPGELHEDGDSDMTLDFGFVTKTYAVGDYVWIDANGDGIQDSGEKPLPGVLVTLLDGNGHTLATTVTDSAGFYLFDELPAGNYQVRFELTEQQAALYGLTLENVGSNDRADSDAVPRDTMRTVGITSVFRLDDSNAELTTSYSTATILATQGIDPTWDAGVTTIDILVEAGLIVVDEADDSVAPGPDEKVAYTGMPGWTMLITALALLSVGGALTVVGQRRRGVA